MGAQVVILAAGMGKRMQSELPKPLVPLLGKPMIAHLLSSVHEAGIDTPPIIVVGNKKEMMMDALGPAYRYAVQEEQLGTGHAVMIAESLVNQDDDVLVLYADHPFVSRETIRALMETHRVSGAAITMATTTVPDFDDWHSSFVSFGRIVRNAQGAVVRIVEYKDASEGEKAIREVNPAYFIFNGPWLWEHLHQLTNANAQGEYYLTDLPAMAQREGAPIATVAIDPKEALGINTKEHLELLENEFGAVAAV